MTGSSRVAAIAFAAAALFGTPASPAEAVNGWERLRQTPETQQVTLTLRDGTKLDGKIREVTDEGLVLIRNKAVSQIRADQILKVTRTSRRRAALWGALIGAAITCPIGAARAGTVVDRNKPSGSERLGVCAIFAGMFGGVGAAVGTATGMEYTIYRAPLEAESPPNRPAR